MRGRHQRRRSSEGGVPAIVVHRSDGSGTTFNWVKLLVEGQPQVERESWRGHSRRVAHRQWPRFLLQCLKVSRSLTRGNDTSKQRHSIEPVARTLTGPRFIKFWIFTTCMIKDTIFTTRNARKSLSPRTQPTSPDSPSGKAPGLQRLNCTRCYQRESFFKVLDPVSTMQKFQNADMRQTICMPSNNRLKYFFVVDHAQTDVATAINFMFDLGTEFRAHFARSC